MWDDSGLTLYDSSQGVVNFRTILAQMFGLPKEKVRVISKFVGSVSEATFPWTHCALAAAAARQLGQPVKLVLSRKMMFRPSSSPRTQQRVRLGATSDGKPSRSSTIMSTSDQCSMLTTKDAEKQRRFNTAYLTGATFGRAAQHSAPEHCQAPTRAAPCRACMR